MSTRGFSDEGLSRMHKHLEGYVERGEIPGLVSLVSRKGEIHVDLIGSKSADQGDKSGNNQIPRDTIFRIASLSKPIAALAAMMLVEECKLRLDEPVDKLLPELANRRVLKSLDSALDETVPAKRSITLRDLLTFRFGFGFFRANPENCPLMKAAVELQVMTGPPRPSAMPSVDEWMRRLGTLPLVHQPGERWLYDSGSDVLGVLIARASRLPLESFLAERIFNPLGMKETSFNVPESKIERLADSYWINHETRKFEIYDHARGGDWSRPPSFPSAAGGLVSTIDDYHAFTQLMLNKGVHDGHRIASRSSIELMTTDQLTPSQKALSGLYDGQFESNGWGFGLSMVTRRDNFFNIGTYGWDGGLGTSWRNDPREGLVTLLFTQKAWTSPNPPNVSKDFWTLAYQALSD